MSTPSPKKRLATPITARKPRARSADDSEAAIDQAWEGFYRWLVRPRPDVEEVAR